MRAPVDLVRITAFAEPPADDDVLVAGAFGCSPVSDQEGQEALEAAGLRENFAGEPHGPCSRIGSALPD